MWHGGVRTAADGWDNRKESHLLFYSRGLLLISCVCFPVQLHREEKITTVRQSCQLNVKAHASLALGNIYAMCYVHTEIHTVCEFVMRGSAVFNDRGPWNWCNFGWSCSCKHFHVFTHTHTHTQTCRIDYRFICIYSKTVQEINFNFSFPQNLLTSVLFILNLLVSECRILTWRLDSFTARAFWVKMLHNFSALGAELQLLFYWLLIRFYLWEKYCWNTVSLSCSLQTLPKYLLNILQWLGKK